MNPKKLYSLIFLIVFVISSAASVFAFQVAPAQPPTSPEAAKIDQLITENRALMGKAQYDEVITKAQTAIALSEKLGDKLRQARSLMQLATAYFHSGNPEKAIGYFKQSAQLAAEVPERNMQSLALNSAAMLLTSSGLSDEALYFYNQSVALRKVMNDRVGEAMVLVQMTRIFMDMGDFAKSEMLLQEAANVSRETKQAGKNDGILGDFVQVRTAALEIERGQLQVALPILESFIARETPATNGSFKIEVRAYLIQLYTQLGNYEKVAAVSEQSLALLRTIKIPQAEADVLGDLAWAKYKLGKAEDALVLLEQAIPLLRQSGGGPNEALFQSYLAEILNALGRKDESLQSHRAAVKRIEQLRARSIPVGESKVGIVATRQKIYSSAIALLVNDDKGEEALEIAEAYHARAFLDVLAESRIDVRKELTREQQQKEDAIFNHITKIQKELWQKSGTPEREQALQQELQQAERELEDFQLELRRTNPHYASISYPQPLRSAQLLKELAPGTALIEYVLGEKNSYAWVAQGEKIFTIKLPAKKTIDELIAQHRAALSEKVSALTMASATTKFQTSSQQLYQSLFQPLEQHLVNAKKLIVVADGSLVYLPFETLSRSVKNGANEFLLERFAISYAPSATALLALKNSKTATAQKGFIGFGDPVYADAKAPEPTLAQNNYRGFALNSLPYTRREVADIAALFPRSEQQTFLGAEAREQNVKTAKLHEFRYVHFAAHGIIDENIPARSGVVLTAGANSQEDGILQMGEVMRLKLNADLVTLSACRTGLGKLLDGEGMIGLTRSFLYAGANSVVVSLWNVNDVATADLMKAFYKNLKQGKAKDEALRQAKIEMLHGAKRTWQHPYFWAPFVLIGEN